MKITEEMARNIRAFMLAMHEQDKQRQEMAWTLVSACSGRKWEVELLISKALHMWNEQADQQHQEWLEQQKQQKQEESK